MDREDAAGRTQRIGQLTSHLRDLGDWQERGHGQDGEQRQNPGVQRTRGHQPRARQHDGQTAQARHHLLGGGLKSQIAEEVETDRDIGFCLLDEGRAAPVLVLERHDIGQALDRIDGEGVELAQTFARARSQRIDAAAQEYGRQAGIKKERRQRQSDRPAEGGQDDQDRSRHDDRDESRRDRVGEEILDHFDVMRGDAQKVARAPARHIGWGQGVEFAEDVDAHLGQQAVGHVVGDPRFHPVQDAGERRHHGQADQDVGKRIAVAHRADDQRGQDAHADEGHHARDAEAKGRDKAHVPGADQLHQHIEQAEPAEPVGADDAFRRRRSFHRFPCFGCSDRGQILEDQFRRLVLGLRRHQALIESARAHQLGVAAGLGHASLVHHQDAVGADDARQAVGEDERGAPDHEAIEGFLNDLLVFGIDRGQRLVQNQDRRIAQKRARDCDALPLAARQAHAALADDGSIALRQARDEFMGVGRARGVFKLGLGRIGAAHAQIVLDGAVEQIAVLADHGDERTQILQRDFAQILAAHTDRAALRIVKTKKELRDRRLARAATADDADAFTRAHGE